MANLTDLGFSRNAIAEVIVSTYSRGGKPNAAPMGAIMESEEQLTIRIFNTSSTYKNLKANGFAVLNLTSDINVFYRTALKEANQDGTLPQEWFKKAATVNAPKLSKAEATVEVKIKDIILIDDQKSKATCVVQFVTAEPIFPKVYCRAFSATLEAIIHSTRVKALVSNPAKRKQIKALDKLIEHCGAVVEKSAPTSRYSEIMLDLVQRKAEWRTTP